MSTAQEASVLNLNKQGFRFQNWIWNDNEKAPTMVLVKSTSRARYGYEYRKVSPNGDVN